MENKEFNIKSSTIEKGIDLAKEFLGKLISPTIEEIGLLISDNIKYIRFKNQVKILLKAREYANKYKIESKQIPIKILVPLLESASLEEQDELQDKWAVLLVNLTDSETNFNNHVFPYILSQISLEEFKEVEKLNSTELLERKEYEDNLKQHDLDDSNDSHHFMFNLNRRKRIVGERMEAVQKGMFLELNDCAVANLVRLGLIKELPPPIVIDEFSTNHEESQQWHQVNAGYNIGDSGYQMTPLGVLFIEVCSEKRME